MKRNKEKFKKVICILICVIFVLGISTPIQAELNLTQEEKNYIEKKNIIKAASSEGTAPFQYTDSNGEIRGICPSVLEEIADMTGLNFEYSLYDSLEEIFNSDYDIIFGISKAYAPDDMVLSKPYFKTETIIYINSSLDSKDLKDKRYANIKGGALPEGIEEKNVIYYKTREECLDAVEAGEADYGYGNPYSIAFYILENGYKNIITIPRGKELREYSIGITKEDEVLLSIINKSIDIIDEQQMQSIVLDETTNIDRKLTFSMVMDTYGKEFFVTISLAIAILLFNVIVNVRSANKLKLQNKRYELLSDISNEYLYEYYVDKDYLELSKKSIQLFGIQESFSIVTNILKEALFARTAETDIGIIELPLINGDTGVFKVISSNVYDNKGRMYSIIGKLIDISEEVAEKRGLIIKAQVDGLTGLYNPVTAKKLINRRIQNSDRDKLNALIVMDCDKFKVINDTFGHLKGDEVLISLSKALVRTFRKDDIIGRIGGDEFCIYMEDLDTIDVCKRKLQQLNTIIQEENPEVYISVSAGVAILGEENIYEDLFKKADKALYEMKRQGGAGAYIYHEKLSESYK